MGTDWVPLTNNLNIARATQSFLIELLSPRSWRAPRLSEDITAKHTHQ